MKMKFSLIVIFIIVNILAKLSTSYQCGKYIENCDTCSTTEIDLTSSECYEVTNEFNTDDFEITYNSDSTYTNGW